MKRRACVVVSSEITVRAFLASQLAAMEGKYDVTLVVNTRNPQLLQELGLKIALRPMPIHRPISPAADLRSFVSLLRLMRRERYDVVHSMTPKAGLLAMVAARLARTPVRIHTFTGQVWATRRGLSRVLLKCLDRIVAACATVALTDSPSQREVLIRERIASPARLTVLARGSVCGVDTGRFRPSRTRRLRVRLGLGIPEQDIVLLFVGRLTRDKGVLALARAFATLADERSDVHLLVVGPDEQQMQGAMQQICERHVARLHFRGFTDEPEAVMAASDVLCLPSYREGFGSVIVEAAAAGVPAVASRIYGIVDAVEEGRTGLLHEPADVDGLLAQLRRIVADGGFRRSLGISGRARVERDFSQTSLTSAILDLYARALEDVSLDDVSISEEIRAQHGHGDLAAPSRGYAK